jgi:hypothetical protein
MHGQAKLFNDVFVSVPELTVSRPGRNEDLINKRDECLVDRYYYYGKFSLKRYDAILQDLQDEFFIEEFTIQKRINQNFDQLAELKAKKPQRDYFKKKWPHLVWA